MIQLQQSFFNNDMIYKAVVLSKLDKDSITVRFSEGTLKGKTVTINNVSTDPRNQSPIQEGDILLISHTVSSQGKETIYIADRYRLDALMLLSLLFLVIVIWIGRLRGIFAVFGMALSFLILSQGLLPSIIQGNDPIIIMLLGSMLIAPLTFYLSHGINRKTTIALVSTFIALAITGFLAYFFVVLTKLTGYAAEESFYLQAQHEGVSIRSILLAGIILGALGVLDDITVSQASIVETLKKTNKSLTNAQLYKNAMKIGRDHIASLVNTLVLVYAGASLPLFLLFYGAEQQFSMVLNQELIATEIVRTLVSSIGIVLAVPITTLIASYFYSKE